MDTASLVVEALEHLGLSARQPDALGEAPGSGVDLLLVEPDGIATMVELKRRALVDEKIAEDSSPITRREVRFCSS